MSAEKIARATFRDAVFKRDGNRCRVCGWSINVPGCQLDAHRIADRNDMPNGGYVKENGISLCPAHHDLAKEFHRTGVARPGLAPDDLYKLIGSSYDLALASSA